METSSPQSWKRRLRPSREHRPTPLCGPGTIQKPLVEDTHRASLRALTGALLAGPSRPAPATAPVTAAVTAPAEARPQLTGDRWLGLLFCLLRHYSSARNEQMC